MILPDDAHYSYREPWTTTSVRPERSEAESKDAPFGLRPCILPAAPGLSVVSVRAPEERPGTAAAVHSPVNDMQRSTPEAGSPEPPEGAPLPRDVALENVVMMTGLGRYDDVRRLLADFHPADVAELLDRLDEPGVRQRAFGLLPPAAAAAVLSLVSPPVRDELVARLSHRDVARLAERLETDDAADLLETLPAESAAAVLAEIPSELAQEVGGLLHHPADTAGGIMQTEYVSVPQYATVEQAIGLIRRARDDVPEVHNVFVVNLERRVTGVLPLRNLVLAHPGESVADIMERQVISAPCPSGAYCPSSSPKRPRDWLWARAAASSPPRPATSSTWTARTS